MNRAIVLSVAAWAATTSACHDESALEETSQALTGGVEVTAADLACHGATHISVSISGGNTTTVTPTDLMLIVDESGSITPTNFELQRLFLIDLVNGLGDLFANGGKVGVVFFAGTQNNNGATTNGARVVINLSADRAAVVAALASATYNQGFTCTGCGVELGTQLFDAGSDPSHNRAAVVLTDGRASTYRQGYVFPVTTPNNAQIRAELYLFDMLTLGGQAGITYFAVGVGPSIEPMQLAQIATGPDNQNVFLATDFTTLPAITVALKKEITGPESTAATLVLAVNPVFGVANPVADAGSVAQVGNDLTWSIPAIQDATVTLGYEIDHAGDADGDFPLLASYAYSDAEGNPLVLPDTTITVTGCDLDADGVNDVDDACPGTAADDPVDPSGCSVGQLCPCAGPWHNHGEYQSCVVHTAKDFFDAGLIGKQERQQLVTTAAHSSCGTP